MSSVMPSRRTVVRTTAWSVPAITIATAAPAFATSHDVEPTYTDIVDKQFTFKDGTGGAVNVLLTTRVPVTVPAGFLLPASSTLSKVTISANTVGTLKAVMNNPAKLGGTSNSDTYYEGGFAATSTSAGTIAVTDFPASGPMTFQVTGVGQPVQVPANLAPGTVVSLRIGPSTSVLRGLQANGTTSSGGFINPYNSTLSVADGTTNADYIVTTFTIV